MSSKGLTAVIVTALSITPVQSDGLAKGGTFRFGEGYRPDHIESLPPEIREGLMSRCLEPRALHDFFRYRNGTEQIVLHYEHLLCGLSHPYCQGASCLHEVYGRSAKGQYKLLRSLYVPQPEGEHF